MLVPRFVAASSVFSFAMLFSNGVVHGQEFPSKPIRIVTNGVGGGGDFASRLIAQGMTAPLGQPVIVDNRASGVLPTEIVSKSSPDGYTLNLGSSQIWLSQFLQPTPYDVVADLTPITLAASSPCVLVIHPSLPVNSVKELIALAKARPGELNYSHGGTGGPTHLSGELFKLMAGVNIVRIPYQSGAQESADLLTGQIQLAFPAASGVIPHIKSSRLRALAVTSAQPSALLPGLPTIASSGLSGYESIAPYVILAAGKTPAAIVNRLNQVIVRVLQQSDVKQKFFNAGVETVASTPEEFASFMKADIIRMGKVIKDAGIKVN